MHRFVIRNPDAWAFRTRFSFIKYCKDQLVAEAVFLNILVSMLLFLGDLGSSFLAFVVLETGLEIDGFSRRCQVHSSIGGVVICGVF